MKSRIREICEALSGYSVWLEQPRPLEDVRTLVSALRPVAIQQELIRIGGADGGYLLPNDFDGITTCISPGVSTEVSFDLALAQRGIHVYMADASVDGPPVDDQRFHFSKKFLNVIEDDNNIRLDSLVEAIDPAYAFGDSILQMDIEGAEYRVLLDASPKTMNSFRIMVVEFHALTRLFAKFPFGLIEATFRKILQTHYVVHIHPNNVWRPTVRDDLSIFPVMEFTFYRKDRAVLKPHAKLQFPNPLDQDNVPSNPPFALPHCWR